MVPEQGTRVRVDRAAVDLLGVASRSRARALLEAGAIHLNDQPCEPSRFVAPGDRLALFAAPVARPPFDHPVEVRWIDDDLAVVWKPGGLETSGGGVRTLENALPGNLGASAAPDALPLPRVVHRLDRRTSGLVLAARSRGALVALGAAFAERRIHKRYRAIVGGRLEGGGVCEQPVGGRVAQTRWACVSATRSVTTGFVTTVDVWPQTGRKHQIRAHMAALGAPILGDDRFALGRPVLRSQGLFLCAVELRLMHPRTGAAITVAAPEPPRFEALRRREARRWERLRGPAS